MGEATRTAAVERFGWLRLACFLACTTSVGALLAKLYGVASMRLATFAVALPCSLALIAVWAWSSRSGDEQLASELEIGFVGGLLGTIAYDLSRVPFALAGQRIFAPISAYGVWILDADSSSRFTEVTGWLYHFLNGISFGVMYALYMRNRHWPWGILWGVMLETIALLTPFFRVFGLSRNPYATGIAYFGHIFYGLPLGWLVYRWNETQQQLRATTPANKWMLLIFACVPIAWTLFSPMNVRKDARANSGEFQVEGRLLNPDWVRIERGQEVGVFNPDEEVSVRVKQTNFAKAIKTGQREAFSFPEMGIYQIFVETSGRTHSSFVLVEPVEELK